MLEIKITDPHLMDKKSLLKLAEFLIGLSGRSLLPAPHPMTMSVPVANVQPAEIPLPPLKNTETVVDDLTKDSNGLPWDHRIHSRTKSKNSDGTWRYMRGIENEKIALVESELRQAVNAPAPIVSKEPIVPIQQPDEANDFPAFMNLATNAVHTNKITQAKLIEIIQEFGLPSVPVVATRPDLIPSLITKLKEAII